MHSAYLKIDRAAKHIDNANELLSEQKPFRYVLRTCKVTGRRSILAENNGTVANEIALACGDAIHNLRSALDHVVWSVVSPVCDPEKHWKVQFPFGKSKRGFDAAVESRQVNLASPDFVAELEELEPYDGGNKLLYLIHDLDIMDKHKLLVPTADYKELTREEIRRQVPDFPSMISGFSGGNNGSDVTWPGNNTFLGWQGRKVRDIGGMWEEELDVPVEIRFFRPEGGKFYPAIPTLYDLVGVTRDAVDRLLAKAEA